MLSVGDATIVLHTSFWPTEHTWKYLLRSTSPCKGVVATMQARQLRLKQTAMGASPLRELWFGEQHDTLYWLAAVVPAAPSSHCFRHAPPWVRR